MLELDARLVFYSSLLAAPAPAGRREVERCWYDKGKLPSATCLIVLGFYLAGHCPGESFFLTAFQSGQQTAPSPCSFMLKFCLEWSWQLVLPSAGVPLRLFPDWIPLESPRIRVVCKQLLTRLLAPEVKNMVFTLCSETSLQGRGLLESCCWESALCLWVFLSSPSICVSGLLFTSPCLAPSPELRKTNPFLIFRSPVPLNEEATHAILGWLVITVNW